MTTITLSLLLLIAFAMAEESKYVGITTSDTETWYDTNYSALIDTVYDSIFSRNLSAAMHEQAKELKENFEKIERYNIAQSLPAAATLYYAEEMMHNNDIEEDIEVSDVLKNIINKSSIFAKNLISGYGCHDIESIRSAVNNNEKQEEENHQYFVFYNPDDPASTSTSKVVPKADGDKLLITVARKYNVLDLKYSFLLDNADYTENIWMLGNITSKTVVVSEEATNEEICASDPKPDPIICIPMVKLFNWNLEDAISNPDARYKAIEKYITLCK